MHLAHAGMPLHLLQQQLGHATIPMTMRYARFHPDYGDVVANFDRVQDELGLATEPSVAGNNPSNTPKAAEEEAAN